MEGDSGRIGGVPNRGGLLPKDSFNAEESADSAGPGSDDCGSARPGRGVCVAGESSSWPGVGIWRTAGEPVWTEGMGEPSRAMLPARVTCDSAGDVRPESRDDEGTACGFDEPDPLPAILTCDAGLEASVRQELRLSVCNVGSRRSGRTTTKSVVVLKNRI